MKKTLHSSLMQVFLTQPEVKAVIMTATVTYFLGIQSISLTGISDRAADGVFSVD